jgi:hypothetical protein
MTLQLRRALSLLVGLALLVPKLGLAGDVVKVKFNAAVREHCHVLHFPSGWLMPRSIRTENGGLKFFLWEFATGDFEFRVSGLLGTKFLIRGVERKFEKKYYTTNLYEVDFSDPTAVPQPASEVEWSSATVISVPDNFFAGGITVVDKLSKHPGFKGLDSMRSGDKWSLSAKRASPDLSLLVLQSWRGTLASGGSDVPLGFSVGLNFSRNHGKLFFDVYSVDIAKKLITITASFNTITPDEAFGKTAWVTERYFLIPLSERRERCLVCEFGRKQQ